ncbi:hypothetical protein shim_04060 [Shimia sp. SK013]|uniref:hypothetical protein n=1 Tax=Shimia sp. SK013 TaxID=1389006 RepID=UPI0006B46D33|nr:hypothetical protein [Shimia sp. SK013]KPA23340.1 hypothetical protein shim_04060 [Shimia sp. SK013]
MSQISVEELIADGDRLIEEITGATEEDRYGLHQKLHRVIQNIRMQGQKIPGRFHDLDVEMLDEEIEDGFDNMPV